MKHSLLFGLSALMWIGTAFSSQAQNPVTDYTEDFTTLYKGATSGNMSRSSYAYPVRYWIREGVTTKNLAVNTTYNHGNATANRSIGFSVTNQGTASSQSEVLVTPKLGGTVSFWVHRSISSTTSSLASEVEIYTMTVDAAGNWTRKSLGMADGTFDGITMSGLPNSTTIPGNDMNTWKQVTLTGVPDQTYIGIRLNGLLIDDFSASKAWLEWPDYVWDGTIIPYIDITPLGTSYTKYYLDADNNLLDSNGQPYKLQVQLKQTVNAGKPTEDMFKYRFQFSVSGQDPLHLTDKEGKEIYAVFENRPEADWTSKSTGEVTHEEVTIDFALYNVDPKYFNTNASLQAVKVDADGKDVGAPISMQRKNTVANDGTWNATSWSNFQFEALVPQPIIVYSTSEPTSTTTASSWNGNTLSDVHAWFINPVGNEAPIYMGNKAGRAEMKITKIEFSDGFGLKEPIALPATVGPEGLLNLRPSVTATTPGIYKGTMSVTVDGVADPFVAKLEGAVKPTDLPTTYLFHKEDGTAGASIPAGWLATGNWQIATMTANQQKVEGKWTQAASTFGNTTPNVILSSPKMSFEEGAEVWYDATCYQLTGEMELLYSTDRANWQVLKKMTVGPVTPTDANPLTDDMFNSFFTSKGTYNENLFKTYKATVPQAGEGYIAFRTSSNLARVDNVMMDGTPVEIDFDIAHISQNVPVKFALNKPKEVKVTFRNLLETIPVGEYEIQIVADGAVVRTFSGDKALTQGADVELSSTYAFSTEGQHTLSFTLVNGDNTVSSAEANVNVVNEGYDEVFQVGASHTTNKICEDYNSWPITPNTGYAVTSEAIYPKSWLQDLNANGSSAANNGLNFDASAPMTGLQEGDKITSISWLGYVGANNTDKKSVEIPVEVYLENTNTESFSSNSETFREDLTLVYKGTLSYDLTKTNSSLVPTNTTPLVDMEEGLFKVMLEEPFEYDGENLRVQLRLPQVCFKEESATDDIVFMDWTTNGTSMGGSLFTIQAKGTASNDATYRLMYQSGNTSRTVNALLPMLLLSKETPANKLTGKVTDSKTEEGIAGVTVTAQSEEGVTFTATTGDDGSYTMEVGNPAFDFTVNAAVDHYRPYTSEETVNLAEGDKEHNIVMVETAVVVSGVVNDKNGALAGATVTLTPVEETSDVEPMTTTTGDDGSYSFKTEGVNASYFVKAEAQYYISQQVRIEVGDEDQTVETITLVHLASLIDGTVVNEDGDAVEGATVTLLADADGAQAMTYTTEANGMFMFTTEQLDTDYTLTIEADGYVTYTKPVEVGTENIALGNVELKYVTVDVTGTVIDEDGNAVDGAEVTLALAEQTDVAPFTATTDADGTFSFTTRYLNSQYTLSVTAAGYVSYSSEVEVNAADVALGNIELTFVTVDITGTVVDENSDPVSDATVTLSLGADDAAPMTATTGADGTFSFTTRGINSRYTLTVAAETYKTYSATVDVEESDLALDDIVLEHDNISGLGAVYFDGLTVVPGVGCIDIAGENVNVVVIDASGLVVAVYNNLEGHVKVDGLYRGIYIVNNHKVLVK